MHSQTYIPIILCFLPVIHTNRDLSDPLVNINFSFLKKFIKELHLDNFSWKSLNYRALNYIN